MDKDYKKIRETKKGRKRGKRKNKKIIGSKSHD